jgi:polyphosphate glucokinase
MTSEPGEDAPQDIDGSQDEPDREPEYVLGIDIGGTHTKAAIVDVTNGKLATERVSVDTPKSADREAMADTIRALLELLPDDAPAYELVGVGFPAVIKQGVAMTAENVADEWLYTDVEDVIGAVVEKPVAALNDADAAGYAEVRFGAGSDQAGTVVVVTLGTGVGSSLFRNGHLVPNMELGRLSVRGKPAGERVANSVREKKNLSWEEWSEDIEIFVGELEMACWPELIILGGGVSKHAHRFLPDIRCRAVIVPARLRNDAGIIGAAVYAKERAVAKATP